jgi:tripeptidyl-peptidase-1
MFRPTFLLSILLVASAKPMVQRAMAVHESRNEPARGFVRSAPAPPAKELTLRIAMTPNNMSGLETELYAVSDPKSKLYGQHLTAEEVSLFVHLCLPATDHFRSSGFQIFRTHRRDIVDR